MEREEEDTSSNLLDQEEEEEKRDTWEETTVRAIQSIEQRCASGIGYLGSVTHFGASYKRSQLWQLQEGKNKHLHKLEPLPLVERSHVFREDTGLKTCRVESAEDIRYIDESAKSSLCVSLCETVQPSPQPSHQRHRSAPPVERTNASILEERYCQAFLGPKNDSLAEKHNRQYVSQQISSGHHVLPKKVKPDARLVVSPLPSEKVTRARKDPGCQFCTETDRYTYISTEGESQAAQSLFLERDFRYYFQHPYSRLFVSYFVIFCNFLVFAEDPVSHSHTESEIPIVGNVFSFMATKYPEEVSWCVFKVLLWLAAIVSGMFFGKSVIHHIVLSRLCRLKMFRDEQGTWMIMFLTSLMFVYIFSMIYNFFLLTIHADGEKYKIDTYMGITNAAFMKCAACGTWIGDFVTAWMVTDMMLQDNLYPEWAKPYRKFWHSHGRLRIIIFWAGSVIMTALVVTLIVSDWISWDRLNRDFIATTELSRAFLASFILVMDLLIVMQDWDFPHFVCDLDIKLPGMHVASFNFNLFQKYVNIPDVNIHVTGKWFNYSLIVFVMILDLNMWKNQIFYIPADYGQYINLENKVFSIADPLVIAAGNVSLWTFEYRSTQTEGAMNATLLSGDISMNSRYLGYPLSVKGMAFMPSLIGFAMFGILTYLYGRYSEEQADGVVERDAGGRGKRKHEVPRSSWRRERGTQCTHYILSSSGDSNYRKRSTHANPLKELIVSWDDNLSPSKAREKPL